MLNVNIINTPERSLQNNIAQDLLRKLEVQEEHQLIGGRLSMHMPLPEVGSFFKITFARTIFISTDLRTRTPYAFFINTANGELHAWTKFNNSFNPDSSTSITIGRNDGKDFADNNPLKDSNISTQHLKITYTNNSSDRNIQTIDQSKVPNIEFRDISEHNTKVQIVKAQNPELLLQTIETLSGGLPFAIPVISETLFTDKSLDFTDTFTTDGKTIIAYRPSWLSKESNVYLSYDEKRKKTFAFFKTSNGQYKLDSNYMRVINEVDDENEFTKIQLLWRDKTDCTQGLLLERSYTRFSEQDIVKQTKIVLGKNQNNVLYIQFDQQHSIGSFISKYRVTSNTQKEWDHLKLSILT